MTTVTAVPLQPVKRGYLIWLWLGIALACVSAYALARQGDPALVREARGSGVVTTASGLQYKILKPGAAGAAKPTVSDVALVSYEGRLLDGSTFDKSQQPTPFPVAPGATVPGFSEGLRLMPKGSKYRFWMKPALAYGAEEKRDPTGKVVIPANSTLAFDVELIDFIPETVLRQMQQQQGVGGLPGGPPSPPPAGRP
jgi:FKBP-type peptidyl-prolyl cis-trans isomerase